MSLDLHRLEKSALYIFWMQTRHQYSLRQLSVVLYRSASTFVSGSKLTEEEESEMGFWRPCYSSYSRVDKEDPDELRHRKARFLIYKVLEEGCSRSQRRHSSLGWRLQCRFKVKIGLRMKRFRLLRNFWSWSLLCVLETRRHFQYSARCFFAFFFFLFLYIGLYLVLDRTLVELQIQLKIYRHEESCTVLSIENVLGFQSIKQCYVQ